MATNATFQTMGLRAEKAIAAHLLLENAHESNLVPDIAKVDYLAGNLGRTHLQTLEGLETFVDDVYVFGYLRSEDCVLVGGRLSCTTGVGGAAKNKVHQIATAINESVGKKPDGTTRGHIQTSIVHTIATRERTQGSAIRETVARIEGDTNKKALERWQELYPDTKPVGLFVAKVDVSEIPMDELQASLPAFERHLLSQGFGLYCIDYTRDFSGTLDREKLVEHLCKNEGFREQGDLPSAMREDKPTILANTDSVGNHVCTWVETSQRGYTARTKLYNKIVSNFEAGEIREPIGGHLADYVDCPNKHLRRTFLHPDVQARGCTRIEVSLYACRGRDLSTETAAEVVGEALALVSPQENEGLFVVQPPAKQWENLAANLDRCLVLANRPQGEIIAAWYGHTITGRVSGVRIRPTKANAESEKCWERAVEWAAAEFGFRACPIFRVDILAVDKEGVELAPLRCYTKEADAKTVLAVSKHPTQLHPNAPDPAKLLPPSATVEWVWRQKKCQAVGKDISTFRLQEVPEIAKERVISTLSTRNREKRLQEIRDAANTASWKRKAQAWLEAEQRRHEEQKQHRAKELERLAHIAEAFRRYSERSKETENSVEKALGTNKTEKVADMAGRRCKVLGFRRLVGHKDSDGSKRSRVVLQAAEQEPKTVWATKGLEKVLDSCADLFETSQDKFKRTTYWLPPLGPTKKAGLEIEIDPARVFHSRESGCEISWNPIRVVAAPEAKRLPILQLLAKRAHEHQTVETEQQEAENNAKLQETTAPKPKNTTKAIDLEPGEYVCRRFASTTWREAPRIVLFLAPKGENGEPTTDVETPTYGHFLQKAVETLGGVETLQKTNSPLLCSLGEVRTTPNKKKARLVSIAAT